MTKYILRGLCLLLLIGCSESGVDKIDSLGLNHSIADFEAAAKKKDSEEIEKMLLSVKDATEKHASEALEKATKFADSFIGLSPAELTAKTELLKKDADARHKKMKALIERMDVYVALLKKHDAE